MGVAPLPPSTIILEHIAGMNVAVLVTSQFVFISKYYTHVAILRNVAFESGACRHEIAALNGIKALKEVRVCGMYM